MPKVACLSTAGALPLEEAGAVWPSCSLFLLYSSEMEPAVVKGRVNVMRWCEGAECQASPGAWHASDWSTNIGSIAGSTAQLRT